MNTLMICTGNICRSPMAEGIWRALLKGQQSTWRTDSAAMTAYHSGAAPDARAQQIMRHHGLDISDLRARPVDNQDFQRFDLILAATTAQVNALKLQARQFPVRIETMLATHPTRPNEDLHDPYYGSESDFETTFNELYTALSARLEAL